MITWWKERLEESSVQEGRCVAWRRCKGRKNKWGENILELARPLTSAYVYLCGHIPLQVRPSTAISNKFFNDITPYLRFPDSEGFRACMII